jgi:putative ABC transport system substrate-binding protein
MSSELQSCCGYGGDHTAAAIPRPGGNLTGFSNIFVELMPKRLELLTELVPQASVIALFVNSNNPTAEPTILTCLIHHSGSCRR